MEDPSALLGCLCMCVHVLCMHVEARDYYGVLQVLWVLFETGAFTNLMLIHSGSLAGQ